MPMDYHVWDAMPEHCQKHMPKLANVIPSWKIILSTIQNDLLHEFIDWNNRIILQQISIGCCCKWWALTLWTLVFTTRRLAKRGICRRRVSICLSVCVCVCVSVTLRYCIKTAKRRITQITPHDSPLTLVFWHQSSLRNSTGITPYGGEKCRWGGLKFVTFDENRAITRKRYKIDI